MKNIFVNIEVLVLKKKIKIIGRVRHDQAHASRFEAALRFVTEPVVEFKLTRSGFGKFEA